MKMLHLTFIPTAVLEKTSMKDSSSSQMTMYTKYFPYDWEPNYNGSSIPCLIASTNYYKHIFKSIYSP